MTDKDQPAPEAEVRPEIAPEIAPEPAAETAPEGAGAPPPAASPAAPARRGGWVPPLIGGALAAVAGFGLSHFDLLKLRNDPDPAALEARLAALDSGLAGLADQTAKAGTEAEAALAAAQAAADKIPATAADPSAELAALSARIDALDTALAAAAGTSAGGDGISAAALAALQAEVEALKTRNPDAEATRAIVQEELAARSAETTAAAKAEAQAITEAATRAAALTALNEAVSTGAAFAGALETLALPDPPAPLTKYAETGLPTLADLAAAFPDPARAALDASLRATGGDGLGDQLWAFLRIQTGARSLTPQEGTDPDAVLSRAEAAVAGGDLPAALTELQALPPEGQAALADWVALAQDRIAAEAALAALAAP